MISFQAISRISGLTFCLSTVLCGSMAVPAFAAQDFTNIQGETRAGSFTASSPRQLGSHFRNEFIVGCAGFVSNVQQNRGGGFSMRYQIGCRLDDIYNTIKFQGVINNRDLNFFSGINRQGFYHHVIEESVYALLNQKIRIFAGQARLGFDRYYFPHPNSFNFTIYNCMPVSGRNSSGFEYLFCAS